jgi:sulfite dehydrogenase
LKLKTLVGGIIFSTAVLAQEDRLIPGPGSTLTENKCKICHELQHIRRQPLSRGEWADNLKNMKERGTPMSEAEMQVILDYLSTYYSREKPAPAPGADTLAAGTPMERLLADKGCAGCHSLDSRVVGPAFREVAARYAGDPAAAARLAEKIRAGGVGAWGAVPMPPNSALSTADAKRLADWVLEQK